MAVDGRVGVGVQDDLVIQHRSGLVAVQVPVGVIGQVHQRGPVGSRLHRNPQLVVAGQGIGNGRLHGTRVPFLPVGARVGQYDVGSFLALTEVYRFPDLLVESSQTPVDVVGTSPIVDCQAVGLSSQRKPSARDPVGATAHGSAEEGMFPQVFVEGIETQHDVHEVPGGIRDFQGL